MGHREAVLNAERTAGETTGEVAHRLGSALQHAGIVVEQRGVASAPRVGSAVGSVVERALDTADTVSEVRREVAAGLGAFLEEPATRSSAALDELAMRSSAAFDALRGRPVGPPAAVRRWPWAFAAAVLGAGVGAAVALVLRRMDEQRGAQEPHELVAVVDTPPAHEHVIDVTTPPGADDRAR